VAIKFDNMKPSLHTAAEVSSQDDSMANIVGNVWCLVFIVCGLVFIVCCLVFGVLFFVQKVSEVQFVQNVEFYS